MTLPGKARSSLLHEAAWLVALPLAAWLGGTLYSRLVLGLRMRNL
ncbi:hypothetical protein [Deinococcus aluminii]|uniref:Uncharacterized protein n=1 Tax=Deinococcus aluminii TaxID=1656885 RepID=A0ABP9XAW9_9DEIO